LGKVLANKVLDGGGSDEALQAYMHIFGM
jgi:hypothetical protein